MKFAHMADCHIGSWRDPKMREANIQAFSRAVSICIDEKVDFVLISGDLFNTAFPAIDGLKEAVLKLKQLKDSGIRVYAIAGSHDYSPSGKTMLDVLENAGLIVNVLKGEIREGKLMLHFTLDKETGAKIVGMHGRRGLLERSYYEDLLTANLESEEGFKIFMFHTAISELKPEALEQMDAAPLSLLPKGFNYYAGGHVHEVIKREESEYGLLAYPGPLFPNNFKELEELHNGGFFIVTAEPQISTEWIPVAAYNVLAMSIDCRNKAPKEVESEILARIKSIELNNTIVTLRLAGCLKSGRVSDIDFKEILVRIYEKSAFFVMKNTSGLTTPEFSDTRIRSESVEQLEQGLIHENLAQSRTEIGELKNEKFILGLFNSLNKEKEDGEKQADFDQRIKDEAYKLLKIQ